VAARLASLDCRRDPGSAAGRGGSAIDGSGACSGERLGWLLKVWVVGLAGRDLRPCRCVLVFSVGEEGRSGRCEAATSAKDWKRLLVWKNSGSSAWVDVAT